MTSVQMAWLKSHTKVAIVDDERAQGNGIIVTLKRGFTFSPGEDNRVRGEDTVAAILKAVRYAHVYVGPFDPD
jgi:hypothetical protein